MKARLVLASFGLMLAVVLSFSLLSQQSLRDSFVSRQTDFHTGLFRIANEHLNDYLSALDGKCSTLADQPALQTFLTAPTSPTDFPRIYAATAAVGSQLMKQFWPQSRVDEVALLGTNDLAASFRLDSDPRYWGEDFALAEVLNRRPDLASLTAGATALIYETEDGGLRLSEPQTPRVVFVKRLSRPGGAGGFLLAVLAPSFFPALFEGLADGSTLSITDAKGRVVWNNGPVEARGTSVTTRFTMGTQPLVLTVQSEPWDRESSGPFDLMILGLAGLALVVAGLLSWGMVQRTVAPLQELSRRLADFGAMGPKEAAPLRVPAHGILSRLIWYFGLTAVLPASLFIGSVFWYSYRVTDNAVERHVAATIRQAESFINYNFSLYNELTAQFIYNDQFQALWPSRGRTFSSSGEAFVEGVFSELKRSKAEFFALNLYDASGKALFRGVETGRTLGDLLGSRQTAVQGSIGQLVLVEAMKNPYRKTLLAFVRKVRGMAYPDHADLGYAAFFVDPYPLSQVYGILGTNLAQYLFVVDRNNHVMTGYGTPSQLDWNALESRERLRVEGDSRMVVNMVSGNGDYRIVGLIPLAEIRLLVLPVLVTGALVVAVHLVAILLLAMGFASAIMRPLRRLLASMESVPGSLPSDRLRWLGGRSELAEIATRFNDLVVENYRTRLLEREAQLNALQQQINPHFMYNTLEAIKWMAYRHQAREISDMASAMGNFLRGNMALGDNFTSLADEIEHLKSYLYIQQIRYDDRFRVVWDIEEGLLQARVVRLILQPLVENAINHGFDGLRRQGILTIRARKTSGLELQVEDNGKGMTEAELEAVKRGLSQEKPGGEASIGLSNVSQRLKLCFGPQASLGLATRLDGGTTVTLSLP